MSRRVKKGTKQIREIEGERFSLATKCNTKRRAGLVANTWRKRDYLVRVIQTDFKYPAWGVFVSQRKSRKRKVK